MAEELQNLLTEGYDLSLVSFSDGELDKLLAIAPRAIRKATVAPGAPFPRGPSPNRRATRLAHQADAAGAGGDAAIRLVHEVYVEARQSYQIKALLMSPTCL